MMQRIPVATSSPVSSAQSSSVPIVGLELFITMAKPEMEKLVVNALEEGIRHFQVVFPAFGELKKLHNFEEYQDLEALHCSLKLAEVLEDLKKYNLQFLKPAMVFSIKTPPRNTAAAVKIFNVITTVGSTFACWFLDVRNISDKVAASSWEEMKSLANAARIPTLGLAGTGGVEMMKLMDMCKGGNVSALLLHDHPHKMDNVSAHEKPMEMGSSHVMLMAHVDSYYPPAQEKIA